MLFAISHQRNDDDGSTYLKTAKGWGFNLSCRKVPVRVSDTKAWTMQSHHGCFRYVTDHDVRIEPQLPRKVRE